MAPNFRSGAHERVIGELSDEEWEAAQPFIPPRARTGRPRLDDRRLLDGILWVLELDAPWREAPERYGNWRTVWQWYRKLKETGRWEHILEALGERGDGVRRAEQRRRKRKAKDSEEPPADQA